MDHLQRSRPCRGVIRVDARPTLVFVTVGTASRIPWLANDEVQLVQRSEDWPYQGLSLQRVVVGKEDARAGRAEFVPTGGRARVAEFAHSGRCAATARISGEGSIPVNKLVRLIQIKVESPVPQPRSTT